MVSHGRCLTGKDIILVCRIVQTSTILYALRKASIYCEVHSNMCNYCPIYIHLYQGNINCGTSSQTDFILNYLSSNFLSNFLKYVSKSPFPPSPASRLKEKISPWYIDICVPIFYFLFYIGTCLEVSIGLTKEQERSEIAKKTTNFSNELLFTLSKVDRVAHITPSIQSD